MIRRSRDWLWLLLLVPMGLGLSRLRFDVEVLNLLPAESPVVQGLKLYQQNFANARELVITINAPDAALAESSARAIAGTLRLQTNLVAEATWTPPWIEHPDQAAELMAYLWLNQPPARFGELTNRLTGENLTRTLEESREALATSFSPNDLGLRGYDPLGLMQLPESTTGPVPSFGSGSEFFASPDGTFRLVFAEAAVDLTTYKQCATWLKQIQVAVGGARLSGEFPSNVVVDYTGRPAFVAEIGGGMERDLAGPSAGTLAVIALLFYFTHHRWRPLIWLVALLVVILAGTLALGGLVYGTLSVVSLGFASILLGLGEDFGIVLYQESQSHPHLPLREIRREAAPGIWWSALTTAGAFLLLNLSGLPGLGQLGTLVAIGVGLAAVVMLYAYLPPLLLKRDVAQQTTDRPLAKAESPPSGQSRRPTARPFTWSFTALLVIAGSLILFLIPPRFDQSPDALRPRDSKAYAALDQIKLRLNRPDEPLWVVFKGKDEAEISRRLATAESVLEQAVTNDLIAGFTLPTTLWPQPENHRANRPGALRLAGQRETLRQAILGSGFTSNSVVITSRMLQVWETASRSTNVFWPTNSNSRWVLEKMVARTSGEHLAIGLVHPTPDGGVASFAKLSALSDQLLAMGLWLSGWELLGPAISKLVQGELYRLVLPILGLVIVTLWFAFRAWREVFLSLATLVFSGLAVHLVMVCLGWSWNMMNLVALPLLLGMGVDFSIHIQLGLRRHDGDAGLVRRSVGRALLLAGSTTVAGFASLSLASNAGIAGLGKVCALGIVCAMLTAVYLLPVWWQMVAVHKPRH
jgi:predicted RND superfamily exporter protein